MDDVVSKSLEEDGVNNDGLPITRTMPSAQHQHRQPWHDMR